MPRGQQTPPEIQWAVIRLSRFTSLDLERIADCLDVSVRTVKRIIAHFRAHGTVPNPGEDATGNAHQWDGHLRDVDVEAYEYPPPPPPPVLIAPWGASGPSYYYYYYPGQDGGGWYIPAIHPSDVPLHAAPPAHDHTPSISQAPRASTRSMADMPEIVHWFKSLDEHDQQNKDGITFAPYGPILRGKGFRWLSQLSRDHVKPSNLVELLGIRVGTAISIMQYAEQDLQAVNAGRFIFSRSS
jgi:hypothetical protein